MRRREFVKTLAGALPLLGGCKMFSEGAQSRSRHSNYWCTWDTQARTLTNRTLTGELKFPGDQGVPGVRDNLNEETLFGEKGWVNLFPEWRGDLMFMVDDGWDVPYGAKNAGEGLRKFGSLIVDSARFPLANVGASNRERLREMARRVEQMGWKGLGVWVACQAPGEGAGVTFPEAKLREDMKRKLDDAAAAGVKYWKVDWGVHNFDIAYRRMMSELKEQLYPELIIDHCRGFDNAINGQVQPHLKPKDKWHMMGRTGRILGVEEYEPVTRDLRELMTFSDVFRTYDTAIPLTTATSLERAVWELLAADYSSSRVVINTEDEPLIAAGLGLEYTIMRSPITPDPVPTNPRLLHKRMAELGRCIAWQRLAPAFGSDTMARTKYSQESISENWHFIPNQCWFTGPRDVWYQQTAPAVVARGIELPKVHSANGEAPYVVASRNPNGIVTVAALPVIDQTKGSRTPKVDVTLAAELSDEAPLGVFGHLGSLTLHDATAGERIFARDILGGPAIDITAQCARHEGMITLPGDLLTRLGSAFNAPSDDSEPGTCVFAGR